MQLFKKYFIPHEENEHQPHILRNEAIIFMAVIIALIEVGFLLHTFVVLPNVRLFALIVPDVLVSETNANRAADNLSTLKMSPILEVAAMEKANDMATNGYFAHTSPAGLTPWYWFKQAGYDFAYAGENLAVNFSDSQDVENAWMNSPGHRANILNGNFTQIGIATAQGTYQGHSAVFVVQLFGTPMSAYLAAATPPLAALSPTPTPVPKPAPAPTPKPIVIAEASNTKPASQDLYIAVKSASVENVQPAQTVPPVQAQAVNPIQNALASPRATVNYVLYFFAALLAFALALNVFIKIQIQHRQLIMNGLVLLLIVTTVVFVNQYLSVAAIKIL